MKFCQRHWDNLRNGIQKAGLSHLVARGGEAAIANLASELEDGSNRENYDPLMGAHNMIVGNAMDRAGLAIMGDVCPQCFLREHCPCPAGDECDYEKWTDYAVNGALEYARELGFVPIVDDPKAWQGPYDEIKSCASCQAHECQDCYSLDFECICKVNGHPLH